MKKLWLIAALAACLLLAACTSVKPADAGLTESNTDAEAPVFAEEETADPGEAGAGVEEAAGEDEYALWLQERLSAGGLVFMVPATDEVLEPYDDFDVFNYNPGVQPMLFYTEQDIPDFRLVSVVTDNNGGDIVYLPDQVLYQRNWLNPERPSLIQILPVGDINSGFGIIFTDPEDPETEHFYILSPTGRGEAGDPPLVFTEIY